MTKNRGSIQDKGFRSQSQLGSSGQRWRPSVFDFKAGSTCPTCQGTGKIPRGQEDELVALIPYNDDRLKSHKCRTCCYVSLVLAFLLITGGLLTAFLFPRDVQVDILDLNSTKHWVADKNASGVFDAILEVQTQLAIHNRNFFPLQVNVLNVTLSHLNYTVGILSYPLKTVNKRTHQKVNVTQNATFTGALALKIIHQCRQNWTNYIYMEASVVLDYTYLSHSSDVVNSGSYYFRCEFVHGGGHNLQLQWPASCGNDGCNSTEPT